MKPAVKTNKLSVSKKMIARLDNNQLDSIQGGKTIPFTLICAIDYPKPTGPTR